MANPIKILYCHCAYAQVIAPEVKEQVLRDLCESGKPFEAVADLCEMSARRDPALARIAADGPARIIACYPRAVKGLFKAAQCPLPEQSTEVINQRVLSPQEISNAISNPEVHPNLNLKSESES